MAHSLVLASSGFYHFTPADRLCPPHPHTGPGHFSAAQAQTPPGCLGQVPWAWAWLWRGLSRPLPCRFSGSQHCGHIHCAYQYREHYHCLDPECNYQVRPLRHHLLLCRRPREPLQSGKGAQFCPGCLDLGRQRGQKTTDLSMHRDPCRPQASSRIWSICNPFKCPFTGSALHRGLCQSPSTLPK